MERNMSAHASAEGSHSCGSGRSFLVSFSALSDALPEPLVSTVAEVEAVAEAEAEAAPAAAAPAGGSSKSSSSTGHSSSPKPPASAATGSADGSATAGSGGSFLAGDAAASAAIRSSPKRSSPRRVALGSMVPLALVRLDALPSSLFPAARAVACGCPAVEMQYETVTAWKSAKADANSVRTTGWLECSVTLCSVPFGCPRRDGPMVCARSS
jgi:hypothetical protein